MIKYYFQLEWKIITRYFHDWGVGTIGGIFLFFFLFLALSIYLFYKIEWAAYAYGFICLSFVSLLGDKNRTDFLKNVFREKMFKKIRIMENAIVAFPFLSFLIVKSQFTIAFITFISSILLSLLKSPLESGKAIRTPFGKKPFEFSIGFRKTFLLIILAYILAGISVVVNNFNLGVSAMLFCFVMIMTYYGFLENYFYVWIFKSTPAQFFKKKIVTAFAFSTGIILPILIFLMAFYTDRWWILMAFWLLGELYLITIILSKYTAYPYEMTLPNGILIGLSVLFPPLLLALIPFFYRQSLSSLNPILV